MRALYFLAVFLVVAYTTFAQPGDSEVDTSMRLCPMHEHWVRCVASCQPHCRNPDPPLGRCPRLRCRPGCVCDRGWIKEIPGGRCIRPKHCPR